MQKPDRVPPCQRRESSCFVDARRSSRRRVHALGRARDHSPALAGGSRSRAGTATIGPPTFECCLHRAGRCRGRGGHRHAIASVSNCSSVESNKRIPGIRGDARDAAALACLAPRFPERRTPACPIAAGVASLLPSQHGRGVGSCVHGVRVTYQRKRH